jgi:hypothetical protein
MNEHTYTSTYVGMYDFMYVCMHHMCAGPSGREV